MLSIEDLLTTEYKLTSEPQPGLLSHLCALTYISADGYHEGSITLSKPAAKILMEHALQIVDACVEVINGESKRVNFTQEETPKDNYKRYDRD